MSEIFQPETEQQLLDVIQWALSGKRPLTVKTHGTKTGYGHPAVSNDILDLSLFSGIHQYDPAELVLRAAAGTPLSTLQAALQENNQRMAFDPVNLGGLYNNTDSAGNMSGSLAGVIAAGLAGPGRIRHGSVRDHVLGFRAVSGRGEVFKSGGNVMKNVTGFDLSKLMTGSLGTLAVMNEITIKVLPKPEKTRTVLVPGVTGEDAIIAMSAALNSPHEITAAAHLPAAVSAKSSVDMVAQSGQGITAVRVEGPAPSVAERCEALKALLGTRGTVEELHSMRSVTFWNEVRDIAPLAANGNSNSAIWRVSVPPQKGAAFLAKIKDETDGEAILDWGGGLIWLSIPPGESAHHQPVRQAVTETGGHATLIRAPENIRRQVPVFQPQPAGIARLSERIRKVFDPERILNPGRMYQDL